MRTAAYKNERHYRQNVAAAHFPFGVARITRFKHGDLLSGLSAFRTTIRTSTNLGECRPEIARKANELRLDCE